MSRFCVIEGTKITLNNKETLPIEKIKVGQEILSFNLSTLQKAQKNDTLLKLSTDTFDGVFQEDLIKNIWKNEAEEYYSINDKLKITGDHIVLAKRDNIFYWTTVDKLLIGDYLFTEQNIFEKIDMIILIKEKVKVYNLQVNDVYNYFANSYLIHNGAPCDACDACGVVADVDITSFALTMTHDYCACPSTVTITGESGTALKAYPANASSTQTWIASDWTSPPVIDSTYNVTISTDAGFTFEGASAVDTHNVLGTIVGATWSGSGSKTIIFKGAVSTLRFYQQS